MNLAFKTFDKVYLDLSWKWLNDPEIKLLTNTPDITREEQIDWFNSLQYKSDYLIWGVEAESVPIGVFGLKNITDEDCEYWGYIGEKQYWGLGLGRDIMNWLEDKARELGMSSIWLKVVRDNTRAIKLYNYQGYVTEDERETLLLMRKKL